MEKELKVNLNEIQGSAREKYERDYGLKGMVCLNRSHFKKASVFDDVLRCLGIDEKIGEAIKEIEAIDLFVEEYHAS